MVFPLAVDSVVVVVVVVYISSWGLNYCPVEMHVKIRTDLLSSDGRSIIFLFAGTSTGQVRRHFSEEGAHQQGPRARLLRLRRLGARQGSKILVNSTGRIAAQRPRVSNRGRYTHMSELTPSPGGCLQQQGVSSNSTTTVPAAEPLKPKLQVYGERESEGK